MEAIRDVTKEVAIVGGGAVVIMAALAFTFGSLYPFYVVISESMAPALYVDDLLVVSSRVDFEDVNPGDIIVFNRPLYFGHNPADVQDAMPDPLAHYGHVIVHRVVEILDNDPRILVAQGDANPEPIPGVDFPITRNEYLGKVVYILPKVGAITSVVHPPVSYAIIGVILSLVAAYELHTHPKWQWRLVLLAFQIRDKTLASIRVIKYDPASNEARAIYARQTLKNNFAVVLMSIGIMDRALKRAKTYEDVPAAALDMHAGILRTVAQADETLNGAEDLLDAQLVVEIRDLLHIIEAVDVRSDVGGGYPEYNNIKRRIKQCAGRLDSMGEDAVLK